MRADSAPPLSVSLLPVWPTRVDTATSDKPQTQRSESRDDENRRRREAAAAAAEQRAQQPQPLIAGHLRIELDEEAGRFVQTLTDPNTNEILRRFPHESQLAFARATRAYTMALLMKR